MKTSQVVFSAAIFAIMFLASAFANTQDWQVAYQTDFSTDPVWITNAPDTLYWDMADETFHATQVNIPYGGNYAYKAVEYDEGSFELEWDIMIEAEQYASGLSFGIFDSDCNTNNDACYVMLYFVADDQGHSIYLEWFSTADPHSYGSANLANLWQLGVWYHVILTFDSNTQTLSAQIKNRDSGTLLCTLSGMPSGSFDADMHFIGNSNVRQGSYQCPYHQFKGQFDNVKYYMENRTQAVLFDLKPGSCPNPLNLGTVGVNFIQWEYDDQTIDPGTSQATAAKPCPEHPTHGKAVLPAAILGTYDFDVTMIDPTTIRIFDNIAPIRWSYEDVATPVSADAEECACNDLGPDGYMDLTVKFDREAVIAAVNGVIDAEMIPVTVTGQLTDGTPFEGTDCLLVIDNGEPAMVSGDDTDESDADLSNYPNPFNPSTTISFRLDQPAHVRLDVFNITGQKVRALANGEYLTGEHSVVWDGTNSAGHQVASGIYFYRLIAGDITKTKQMILLK